MFDLHPFYLKRVSGLQSTERALTVQYPDLLFNLLIAGGVCHPTSLVILQRHKRIGVNDRVNAHMA